MGVLNTVQYPKTMGIETTPAKLFYHSTPARMDLETKKNGLHIESSPVRLEIRNRAFFDDIGLKCNETQRQERVQKGKEAVIESMRQYAQEGEALFGPDKITLSQLAQSRTQENTQDVLVFIPEHKPELIWHEGSLDINNVPDELNIEWDTGGIEFEYQPYSVRFWVDKWEKATSDG